MKEGRADAVKIEGGRNVAESVRKMVEGGIAVMGHPRRRQERLRILREGFESGRRLSVRGAASARSTCVLRKALR